MTALPQTRNPASAIRSDSLIAAIWYHVRGALPCAHDHGDDGDNIYLLRGSIPCLLGLEGPSQREPASEMTIGMVTSQACFEIAACVAENPLGDLSETISGIALKAKADLDSGRKDDARERTIIALHTKGVSK